MIFCLVCLGISLLALILGIVLFKVDKYRFEATCIPCMLGGAIVTIVMTLVVIIAPIQTRKELNMFMEQKNYIEHYEPTTEYDNAAITSKKVELNEWLFEKQYNREHYTIFSFHSDDILDIEPIK